MYFMQLAGTKVGVLIGILLLAVLPVVSTAQSAPCTIALEEFFGSSDSVWHLTSDEFMAAQGTNGFVWEFATRRTTARSVHPGLSFAGVHVWEAISGFETVPSKD